MEKKLFGRTSKLGSPKERLLGMLRMLRAPVESCLSASQGAVESEKGVGSYNPEGYKMVKARMSEVESMRAMLMLESRHERWKAGGAL